MARPTKGQLNPAPWSSVLVRDWAASRRSSLRVDEERAHAAISRWASSVLNRRMIGACGLAASGQDEIRAHLDRLYTAVPDFTVDVTSGFVAVDQGVVEWESPAPTAAISPDCHPPPASTSRSGELPSRVGRWPDPPLHRVLGRLHLPVQLEALPAPGTAPGTPMP